VETSAYYHEFMICQIEKINEEKLLHNRDDDLFVIHWIQNYSELFRNSWEISLCKSCIKNKICGSKVLKKCNSFKEK
jgi:hypothetical protein